MALEDVTFNFPLNKGVSTKDDPKQLPIGRLLTLENGVFTTPNEIRKRNGYTLLNNDTMPSGQITSGAAITSFENELCLFDGTAMYAYAEANQKWSSAGNPSTNSLGNCKSIQATQIPVISNNYIQVNQDCAYASNGYVLSAWDDGRGTVRFSVIDSTSGAIIIGDSEGPANSVNPKVFTLNGYFLVFYIDTVNLDLNFFYISQTSPEFGYPAPTVVYNNMDALYRYDVCSYNGALYAAVNTAVGGGQINVIKVISQVSIGATYSVAAENADNAIGIFADSVLGQLWVSYDNGTNQKYFILDDDMVTSVLAPTVISNKARGRNITGYASNGEGAIIYEYLTAVPAPFVAPIDYVTINYSITLNNGTVGTSTIFLVNHGIISKCVTIDNVPVVIVCFDSKAVNTNSPPQQSTYYMVSVNNPQIVYAKMNASRAGGITNGRSPFNAAYTSSNLCEINLAEDSYNYYVALLNLNGINRYKAQPVTSGWSVETGVILEKLNFNPNVSYVSVQNSSIQYTSGAQVSIYDGQYIVEQNFNQFPDVITAVQLAGFGSLAAGTYQVCATYEWLDQNGVIHRSRPSQIVSVTVNLNDRINIGVINLNLTSKSNATINLYVKKPNESVFFLVKGFFLNSRDTYSQSFTLSATSTELSTTQLYTTGGVVANNTLPATSFVFNYKNRLIAIPSENKQSFWYSKEAIPASSAGINQPPADFSLSFVQNINTFGKDCTCGIQMDDKMVFFSNENILYLSGDGPSDTGTQNDFSNTDLITSDVGCVDPKSLVLMPLGVMFKSSKGIYLLTRSLQVKYIGSAVEAYNSSPVNSALLMKSLNEVRFSLSSGEVLVYNYYMTDEDGVGQWSVFTGLQSVSSCMYKGKYTYVKSNGRVYTENTSYTDAGTPIIMKIVTSWLSFAGIQAFQRLRKIFILGEYKSAHNLIVKLAYDFIDSFTQTETISVSSDPTPYQFRIDPEVQTAESIKISIEDGSTTGQSMSLSNLNFEVAKKKGSDKLPATKTY